MRSLLQHPTLSLFGIYALLVCLWQRRLLGRTFPLASEQIHDRQRTSRKCAAATHIINVRDV